MTPQEINEVIAKECGWRFDPCTCGCGLVYVNNPQGHLFGVPNYFQSLDYCVEFEAHLDSISKSFLSSPQPNMIYLHTLSEVVNTGKKLWDNGTYLGGFYSAANMARATANQRCEAFLKVRNLWKD